MGATMVTLEYPWVPVMDPLEIGGTSKSFDYENEYWFMRPNWDQPEKFVLADQPAWFNIANLYFWDASTGPVWPGKPLYNLAVQPEQPNMLRSMFKWLMGVLY